MRGDRCRGSNPTSLEHWASLRIRLTTCGEACSFEALLNLQRFIEDGGLFITIANIAQIPIGLRRHDRRFDQDARQLNARGRFSATFAIRRAQLRTATATRCRSILVRRRCSTCRQVRADLAARRGPRRRRWRWVVARGVSSLGLLSRIAHRSRHCSVDAASRTTARAQRPGEEAAGEGPFGPQAVTPPAMRPRVVLRFNTNEKDLYQRYTRGCVGACRQSCRRRCAVARVMS